MSPGDLTEVCGEGDESEEEDKADDSERPPAMGYRGKGEQNDGKNEVLDRFCHSHDWAKTTWSRARRGGCTARREIVYF